MTLIEPKKRNEMAGSHFTAEEKQFIRVHAAQHGQTISTFIRSTLNEVLSKVDVPNNPFKDAKK
ncbi:hypothetical protein ABFO59_06300 [Acinetobacter radioresistens]|uniref:hypothetical protein n=1 Tax=Acinetobacter radioresistens TaxID=40216 RepID=UPI00321438C0